jgi:hypothetical protein
MQNAGVLKCAQTLIYMLVFADLSLGQEAPKLKTVALGDDTVQLAIYYKTGSNVAYAHVHENETASLEAGMRIWRLYGGTLVSLKHTFDGTTNRNVTFRYSGTTYRFDPNRIYTDDSQILAKSIEIVSGKGKITSEVIREVRKLADNIWNEIKDYPRIIALHNNKNVDASIKRKWLFWTSIEPESYNITSYIKKYDFASDSNKSCSDIYINPEINNSEFFIVTDKGDFNAIATRRFSVVLQNGDPVDDGSMSVFASKNQKKYINAEAKHGRIEIQTYMLDLVRQL